VEKPINTYLQHLSWNKGTVPTVPVQILLKRGREVDIIL
jgi:hypothetical protein